MIHLEFGFVVEASNDVSTLLSDLAGAADLCVNYTSC